MSRETKPPPASAEQVNARLLTALIARLENYAKLVGRPQATVSSDALMDYLDWRIPQIEALQQAVATADQGGFAGADEVEQLFKRYEA